MSRARKPRSVAIELPHSGAVCVLHVRADVVEHQVLGLGQADGGARILGQPGLLVHRPDDRHPGQQLVVGVDDHVDALAEHVQVPVGDQGGDLDQRVPPRSRPVISQSIHTR